MHIGDVILYDRYIGVVTRLNPTTCITHEGTTQVIPTVASITLLVDYKQVIKQFKERICVMANM